MDSCNSYPNSPFRYRIGIINDFRNSFSFLDYRDWGSLQTFDACHVRGEHRGYQEKSDSICVFLNFAKRGEFTSKDAALVLIRLLVSEAPRECSRDFDQSLSVLLEALA